MVQQMQQQQQQQQPVPPPPLQHLDLNDPTIANKIISLQDQQVLMQMLKPQPILLPGQQPPHLPQQPSQQPPG